MYRNKNNQSGVKPGIAPPTVVATKVATTGVEDALHDLQTVIGRMAPGSTPEVREGVANALRSVAKALEKVDIDLSRPDSKIRRANPKGVALGPALLDRAWNIAQSGSPHDRLDRIPSRNPIKILSGDSIANPRGSGKGPLASTSSRPGPSTETSQPKSTSVTTATKTQRARGGNVSGPAVVGAGRGSGMPSSPYALEEFISEFQMIPLVRKSHSCECLCDAPSERRLGGVAATKVEPHGKVLITIPTDCNELLVQLRDSCKELVNPCFCRGIQEEEDASLCLFARRIKMLKLNNGETFVSTASVTEGDDTPVRRTPSTESFRTLMALGLPGLTKQEIAKWVVMEVCPFLFTRITSSESSVLQALGATLLGPCAVWVDGALSLAMSMAEGVAMAMGETPTGEPPLPNQTASPQSG